MSFKRKVIVLGGGTIQPIRSHLGLCAPAFGTTASYLAAKLDKDGFDREYMLTKMADADSDLVTNEDVSKYIDTQLEDPEVGTIILNVAFTDYDAVVEGQEEIPSGFHSERLKTDDGQVKLVLTPAEKIIKKIRLKRPDIFLVGFKTTTNKTSEEQFKIALKMMKSVKCNLVLANDTVTRNNMIITAEESIYGQTTVRKVALDELYEIAKLRADLTYNKSKWTQIPNTNAKMFDPRFQEVLKFLIENGGFIENNGNGFTPGHFCQKQSNHSFLSSQRKANHNKVFEEGVSLVVIHKDESFEVMGERKASVGARSQYLMFKENPAYAYIVHTHNPLKEGSLIPVAEQRPFQCGSLECGMNTVSNLKEFGPNIKAVYLNKHGANIMFKYETPAEEVIQFIKDNIELGVKTT